MCKECLSIRKWAVCASAITFMEVLNVFLSGILHGLGCARTCSLGKYA
jgi:hypothetical protein